MLSSLVAKFGSAALKIIAVILVVVGLFLWGRHYQLQDKIHQQQLTEETTRLSQANSDIEEMKRQYAAIQLSQTLFTEKKAEQTERVVTITRTINSAPKTVSCINSPAITAVLAGLRQPAATSTNASGKSGDTSKPANVP